MTVSMVNLSYNQASCESMIDEHLKMNVKKSYRENHWTRISLLDMCISNLWLEMKLPWGQCLLKLWNPHELITGHRGLPEDLTISREDSVLVPMHPRIKNGNGPVLQKAKKE